MQGSNSGHILFWINAQCFKEKIWNVEHSNSNTKHIRIRQWLFKYASLVDNRNKEMPVCSCGLPLTDIWKAWTLRCRWQRLKKLKHSWSRMSTFTICSSIHKTSRALISPKKSALLWLKVLTHLFNLLLWAARTWWKTVPPLKCTANFIKDFNGADEGWRPRAHHCKLGSVDASMTHQDTKTTAA